MVIQLNHFNGDFPILSNRFLKVIVKYIRIAFHSFLNIIRKYLQLVNLFITSNPQLRAYMIQKRK